VATVEKDQHKPTVHIGVIGHINHEETTLLAAIKMVMKQQAKEEQPESEQTDEQRNAAKWQKE
jgi:translation elongation factor EF-Tu-like GTPase